MNTFRTFPKYIYIRSISSMIKCFGRYDITAANTWGNHKHSWVIYLHILKGLTFPPPNMSSLLKRKTNSTYQKGNGSDFPPAAHPSISRQFTYYFFSSFVTSPSVSHLLTFRSKVYGIYAICLRMSQYSSFLISQVKHHDEMVAKG